MSISFGGLGLMTLRNPLVDAVGSLWGKGNITSMFWLIVFSIVCLVLAYLTNPSETSFRTFLTEQSFRQHLSRLDDSLDDNDHEANATARSSSTRSVSIEHTFPFNNRSPFHFANRATVSLRTPKHVFHGFGIFTIAAIIPVTKSERMVAKTVESTSIICDSWYIGVFGRWWRGGVLEAWYQDVFSRTNDEESWSSGIMGMKTTERHSTYSGLPFSTKNLPPHLLSRGSPPRLRNRDKSSQQSSHPSRRSSTPPPLPKSVSLPLHATRPSKDHTVSALPLLQTHATGTLTESSNAGTPGQALASFDQSPLVIDLLHQVASSKASILDLRNQLDDCRVSALQSHAVLNDELEACREKKRQEDSIRNDLKTRTKTLDDSKRQAESQKRDAEKRLKAVITRRDDMHHRIEDLSLETARLQRNLASSAIGESDSHAKDELQAQLAQKREEVQSTEEAVTVLSSRSKDVEDRLAAQKEKLRLIRERVQSLEEPARFSSEEPISQWPPIDTPYDSEHSTSAAHNVMRDSPPATAKPYQPVGGQPDIALRSDVAPRQSDAHLVLAAAKRYSSGDKTATPMDIPKPMTSNFSPFADLDQPNSAALLSPTSSTLIPAGLMSSLALDGADGMSRSFQSDSDTFLDRHWRNDTFHGAPHRQSSSSDALTSRHSSSPTALHGTIGSDTECDPFEVRFTGHDRYSSAMDMQRASLLPRNPSVNPIYPTDEQRVDEEKVYMPRRWFSSRDKAKGLNPDAKVFNFAWKSRHGSQMSYDALNPHGLGQHLTNHASDNNTLVRAFAPSAAEREVLQRALGGSTNTSLERLPSLSDVGSIPASPVHMHAHAQPVSDSTMDKIPSWLQSLPRIRKPSPWDDDEPGARNR